MERKGKGTDVWKAKEEKISPSFYEGPRRKNDNTKPVCQSCRKRKNEAERKKSLQKKGERENEISGRGRGETDTHKKNARQNFCKYNLLLRSFCCTYRGNIRKYTVRFFRTSKRNGAEMPFLSPPLSVLDFLYFRWPSQESVEIGKRETRTVNNTAS